MYDRVKTSLLTLGNFSAEQLQQITGRLEHHSLTKGEQLLQEGKICRHFYFVDKGCFRQHTILDSGAEATLNLWVTGEWLFDYKSFISQSPAVAIIEAVEDSEVFALSIYDFHELVKKSDLFFRLAQIMDDAVKNNDYQHNRLSPEQKYELLLANRPELLHRFPLKHIASYLGITPETLSRIRKRISS